jgi:hypothetical protein
MFTNGTYNETDGTGVNLWNIGVQRSTDVDYSFYDVVQTRKRWLSTVVEGVKALF